MGPRPLRTFVLLAFVWAAGPIAATAQETEETPATDGTTAEQPAAADHDSSAGSPDILVPQNAIQADDGTIRGPVTNLPLPRFVSLKVHEANVRRGPSLSHRIDWIFVRRDMPLQIVAEYGNWRRVIDREGLGGWVHYSLLSGNRTVIVDLDQQPLFSRPDTASPEVARLEAGVVARIDKCDQDWCRLSVGGYRGWVEKTSLWGVGPDEILE